MDILTIEEFKQELMDFINKQDHIMPEHKYLVLSILTQSLYHTLVQRQYKVDIQGLKELNEKIQEQIKIPVNVNIKEDKENSKD